MTAHKLPSRANVSKANVISIIRFYIFRETKINNQINDRLTIKPNIIFETVVQKDPHRGLPAAY